MCFCNWRIPSWKDFNYFLEVTKEIILNKSDGNRCKIFHCLPKNVFLLLHICCKLPMIQDSSHPLFSCTYCTSHQRSIMHFPLLKLSSVKTHFAKGHSFLLNFLFTTILETLSTWVIQHQTIHNPWNPVKKSTLSSYWIIYVAAHPLMCGFDSFSWAKQMEIYFAFLFRWLWDLK